MLTSVSEDAMRNNVSSHSVESASRYGPKRTALRLANWGRSSAVRQDGDAESSC